MSKNVNHTTRKPNIYLLPIILMMGFIPLIVHMYQYNSNLSQFDWFPADADMQMDFFLVWKMIALVVVGVGMEMILLFRRFCEEEQLRFDNSFYLLLFYLLFVVMSALFSSRKYWVAHGTYELFEPVWVLFAYMILCYYTFNYVQEEKQVDTVLLWSGVGMAVVTLIGIFQYFGLDFFKSSLGRHLISNPEWWGKLEQLHFSFPEKTAYTTLYNPNFLSFYFGMLIPLLACLFIGAKKIWQRVLLAIAEVMCLLCLKAGNSASGWMALAIGAVIFVLVLLSRRKKLFIAGAIVTVIGIVAAVVLGNTTAVGRSVKDTIVGTYHMKDQFALNDVTTGDENVTLNIHGSDLNISYLVGEDGSTQIFCQDAEGNELSRTVTDEVNQISTLDDTRFAGIQVQPTSFGEGFPGITVTIEGMGWNFLSYQGSGYYYLNPSGKLVKFEKIKQSHLFRDDAMSKRGNIWNRTLPLLGKHILMGSGANTFMFECPQNDYISQAYIYGLNSFDVKAHSWYLQQWVENGLLGTLALLGFCFWYLIQAVRIYRRADLQERISWIGLGLFAAVLVYMVAALVNDSNVCTAPVFWGMLGLGIAVNRMVSEQQNLFVEPAAVAEPKTTEPVSGNIQTGSRNGNTVSTKKSDKNHGKNQSRKKRKNQKKK